MLSKHVLNSKYQKVKECNNNRKNNKLTKGKWPHAKLSTRVPLYSDLKGEYSKFHMSRTAIAKLTTKKSFRVEKLHKTQICTIHPQIKLYFISYKSESSRPWAGTRPKGQLISKANFEVFIWTKKRAKIFLYFCPSL